ncbi:MAG: N-acetyltransferase [Pedobacter sp.]|nr:MAG: N-acetyltransferase [Pedobacter sp.]
MKNLSATLKNNKVLLRPLQISDEPLLWPIAQDPDLCMYANKDLTIREELGKYLRSAIAGRADGTCAVWTIIDAVSGKVAGSTRLAEISWPDARGQIGWTWIGKEFQGTGLNKAMKYEILKFGFESLGLNRIELKADERNMRSRKAMLGIGAREEGILREHLRLHTGFIRNSVYYSILKSEWPDIKKTLEDQIGY